LQQDSLEERLERLERLLREALQRLERLEEALAAASPDTVLLASRLAIALTIPAVEAIEAARRVVALAHGVDDPIARDVLEILSRCEPLTVSEATRRLRRLRGSASRTTVRQKLRTLEEKGLVVNLGTKARPLYTLRDCVEENQYAQEAA